VRLALGRHGRDAGGPRPLSFFGSVLAYSRHRQLTFSCSERFAPLAIGLAANLEQLGGVPAQILFDNPKTVTLRDVAGAAVLNPELVRLAAHYRFRPQTTAFYHGWLQVDPESDGSRLTLFVSTVHGDAPDHEVMGTLDAIRRLVEADV
jgi:transposase